MFSRLPLRHGKLQQGYRSTINAYTATTTTTRITSLNPQKRTYAKDGTNTGGPDPDPHSRPSSSSSSSKRPTSSHVGNNPVISGRPESRPGKTRRGADAPDAEHRSVSAPGTTQRGGERRRGTRADDETSTTENPLFSREDPTEPEQDRRRKVEEGEGRKPLGAEDR